MGNCLTKIIAPNGFIDETSGKLTIGISVCYKLDINKLIKINEGLKSKSLDNYKNEIAKCILPPSEIIDHIYLKNAKGKSIKVDLYELEKISEDKKKENNDFLKSLFVEPITSKESIENEQQDIKPSSAFKEFKERNLYFRDDSFILKNKEIALIEDVYKDLEKDIRKFIKKSDSIFSHAENLSKVSRNKKIKKEIKKIGIVDTEEKLKELLTEIKKDKNFINSSSEIDINVIINNLSIIEENKILSRKLGFIKDYKIIVNISDVDTLTFEERVQRDGFETKLCSDLQIFDKPLTFSYEYPFELRFKKEDKSYTKCRFLILKYCFYGKKNKYKYAFLPGKANNKTFQEFFTNSILKNKKSETDKNYVTDLKCYSDLSVQQNFYQGNYTGQQTKGLIFSHKDLNQIVKPFKSERINNLSEMVWDEETLNDGFCISLEKNGKSDSNLSTSLTSLTRRKTSIYIDNKENLTESLEEEAFLKVDNFTEYIGEDGEIKHEISNVICEYKGEQFGLEGVFGSDVIEDKIEDISNKIANPDSELLELSKRTFKNKILYRTFPYREVETNDAFDDKFKYCFQYSYPKDKNTKLEFGNTYRKLAHLGFINGYSLPLTASEANKSNILTVEDFISHYKNEEFLSKSCKYQKLESKKPLTITTKDKNNSINELIVKSDAIDDSKQFVSCINVWGPTDTLRNIWLNNNNNLAKLEQVKKGLSFDLLKEAGKESSINKNNKEGQVYTEKYSNFLTNPQVSGFKVALSYYEDYYKDYDAQIGDLTQIENPDKVKFSYKKNNVKFYNQKEVEIKASGAKQNTFISKKNNNLDINLKKGAQLYLQFTSINTNDVDNQDRVLTSLANQFWWNKAGLIKNIERTDDIATTNNSGALRDLENDVLKYLIENEFVTNTVKLTHAVKKPLITPTILSIDSNKEDFTNHIKGTLEDLKYEDKYELGQNIFGKRVAKNEDSKSNYDKYNESTIVQLDLWAHIERLDAYTYFDSEGNKQISFVENILATGNLELLCRKEEYYDGYDDYLTVESGRTTPELPLATFDDQNKFISELKIKFSEEELNTLKKIYEIEEKPYSVKSLNDKEKLKYLEKKHWNNEFLNLKTKLQIKLDIQSTKFEEREYALRNTSKFIGYFNDEQNNTKEQQEENNTNSFNELEPFTLTSKPFKVMVLNNKKPKKAEIKYTITTINENKTRYNRKKIKSSQQGNIITIYMDRGRLSSGKNERIGIIFKDGDSNSDYYKYFEKHSMFSKIGKDIMSDLHTEGGGVELKSEYLKFDNLTPKTIKNDYDYKPHEELNMVSYLPKFDPEKGLWKFAIEVNILDKEGKDITNELHNPFLQLNFVNLQPFSMNYVEKDDNGKISNNFEHDCRFSVPTKSTWAYLLPKRDCEVSNFDKPGLFDNDGYFNLKLVFKKNSLSWLRKFNGTESKLRSNFIVVVQATRDKVIWENIGSTIDTGKKGASKIIEYHILLNEDEDYKKELIDEKFTFNKVKGECEYRIVVTEIEWFDETIDFNKLEQYNNILNNERFRKRYIEIIY